MKMQDRIKFSIVVPVYNVEKYISKCLDSLLNQTYDNYEIIVINDGSTDKSLQIANNYEKNNPQRIICFSQENKGLANVRNAGINRASGQYIFFVDSDDYIEDDYLQVFANYILKESADVLISGHRMVDENGNILSEIAATSSNDTEVFGRPGTFISCTRVYKLDFLKRESIKFPEGKLYEDIAFCLLTKYFPCPDKVKAIPYIGYNYVQREGSIMHNRFNIEKYPFHEIEDAIILIRKRIYQDFKAFQSFEFDVLYYFAGLVFLNCRKGNEKIVEKICDYSTYILDNYFDCYDKNIFLGINKTKSISFVQRLAICSFVYLNKKRKLKKFARLKCKF